MPVFGSNSPLQYCVNKVVAHFPTDATVAVVEVPEGTANRVATEQVVQRSALADTLLRQLSHLTQDLPNDVLEILQTFSSADWFNLRPDLRHALTEVSQEVRLARQRSTSATLPAGVTPQSPDDTERGVIWGLRRFAKRRRGNRVLNDTDASIVDVAEMSRPPLPFAVATPAPEPAAAPPV